MKRLISPGIYALVLLFLGGIWLAVSPFAMQSQPAGAIWKNFTINNIVIGAILIGVSLIGIVGYIAFALRDLLRELSTSQPEQMTPEQMAS